jgi:peptidoglycan/LPS O-acetylase OafA/YrhL
MPRQIAAGVGPLTVAGKVVRAVIWLDWGICAVIYGIMLNRVESVVISGFIIALCGLALLVIGMCLPFRPVGRVPHQRASVWVGAISRKSAL